MRRYNIVNNTLGWLCFVIAAATYLLTLEPTASFWDCPEFIAQGAKLEVGHPPGNPIFMLAARFFVTIFGGGISNAAIAVNSMSALLSAATILLLFWTITHLVKKIIVRDDATEVSLVQMLVIMGAGLCGALAYTWSDTFWFSAVEGEVYAFSSFCTALVFWLILKWENRADNPDSDRYLILIAYVIGVSIAVHLLNLLCISAIVLVFYYRKFKNITAKGSLIALALSFVLIAVILFGLVPGFVKVAQGFELFFVNVIGLSFNMGVLIYAIVLLALFCYTIRQIYYGKNATKMMISVFLVALLSGMTLIGKSIGIWVVVSAAVLIALLMYGKKLSRRVYSVAVISIFFIFIGYSSYALLLIRASANTPMNQNAPDNVFTLASYLNREQYGKTPLLMGPVFAEQLETVNVPVGDGQSMAYVHIDANGRVKTRPADLYLRDANGAVIDEGEYSYTKQVKTNPDEPDKYVKESYTPDYQTTGDVNMLFTRMYSNSADHIRGYKDWSLMDYGDLRALVDQGVLSAQKYNEWYNDEYAPLYEVSQYLPGLQTISTSPMEQTQVWKPSFIDNLRYFFNYQLNHMYWRYFMWNFAGRQNDLQGNGEPHLGNWISGIPFIDNIRLGDQTYLPDEYSTGNKGHNVFYMLPLLLGLLGIVWQSLLRHRNNPMRGIEQFWVVFFLFFMTGVAIVLYLNQPPGQPRERDYAFAGSFYAFAIWVGMGVPAIWHGINKLFEMITKTTDKHSVSLGAAVTACIIGLLVPLQMVSQTWDDHDRSHRYTTRDFGENYLNSLDENAIIFTNGDNDTFPLWYAQEVGGVRTDVRVVNLSYLGTDWYAHQLQHPYYDAAAVKTLAKPSDYAYDKLAYSYTVGGNDSTINALDGLRLFYDSPTDPRYDVKLLTTPNMKSPIDTAAVIQAFNINVNSIDSITKLPYLSDINMPALSKGAFYLNTLLSFDITANSVNDGFKRPVYFASTVLESYYLDLQPYLYQTGMAYQVTPFKSAPISPMAEKSYENIVSKYKWGGLDDAQHNQGLYLDETVRRMLSSVRNSMIETADQLMANGDLPASEFAIRWARENNQPVPVNRYDMARNLLNLMQEKLPAEVSQLDQLAEMYTAIDYMKLYYVSGNEDDLKRAEKIVDGALTRYGQLSRYALSVAPSTLQNMGPYTSQYARYHLPMFIAFKNMIAMLPKVKAEPDKYGEIAEGAIQMINPDMRILIYPMLYIYNFSAEDIAANAYGDELELFQLGADMAELHQLTGVDRMQVTNDIANQMGITVDQLKTLNPYLKHYN